MDGGEIAGELRGYAGYWMDDDDDDPFVVVNCGYERNLVSLLSLKWE